MRRALDIVSLPPAKRPRLDLAAAAAPWLRVTKDKKKAPPHVIVLEDDEVVAEALPPALAAMSASIDPRQLWLRWLPNCNGRNAHPRDTQIWFDESYDPSTREKRHDYVIPGVGRNVGISATGIMHHYWPHFDRDREALLTAQRNDSKRPENKNKKTFNPRYKDETPVAIAAKWQSDQETGSARHLAMENYLMREPGFDDWGNLPYGLLRFLVKYPTLEPYRLEWSILHRTPKGYYIYGQPDALFFDTATQTLVLVDWKNTRNFTLDRGDKIGTHPRTWRETASKPHMYAMQLRVYMSILAADYALPYPITHGIIVNFPPDTPDQFEEERVEPMDYTAAGGLFEDFPWDDASPLHRRFDIRAPADFPSISFDDPRVLAGGPTSHGGYIGHHIREAGDTLAANVIWTGAEYVKDKYALDASPFAPERQLMNKGTWAVAAVYEEYLLSERKRDLLIRVGRELYSKTLPCWCWPAGQCTCHVAVLIKYANLLGGKHVQVPRAANDIRDFFSVI